MLRQTSILAYKEKVLPELTDREYKVYNVLKLRGPSTSEEVAGFLGVATHTISGRFGAGLARKGFIRDSGLRRVTKSGCSGIVWGVK